MNTDLSIFKQDDVVVGAGRTPSALSKELAKGSGGIGSRRIQTNTNGTFKRLVNGEQIGDALRGEINVLVLWALSSVSRIYYKEKYDANKDATLPNCWSNMGDKPEEAATDAQHANCADCPQNIKGSGENGSKACRYQRRISLLVEGDSSGDIYQFNIPAKSLFGKGSGNTHPFESYLSYLAANGEDLDNVVTNIRYDDNADTMELLFTPLRHINDTEYALVQECQLKPDAQRYTKITVAQADQVTKLPAPTATESPAQVTAARLEKEAAAVTPVDEPDAPIEEPVKRQPKKDPKPIKDDIADVLSAWADDE